jgi:DNA-binding response OmpR family regulator
MQLMNKILIIDDDRFLLERLGKIITAEGHEVVSAPTAAEGFRALAEHNPDLLVLDLSLPDEDGFTLCRRIRSRWTLPIVMLTSRAELVDKVIGLEVGADDYLTKPFEGRELVARIRAHLRRTKEYRAPEPKESLEVGPVKLDEAARQVTVNGDPITLTDLEFRLLSHLMHNAGRALGREQLFETVWGYQEAFNTNSLEVFIYRLRRKIEAPAGARLIHTVRGFGYKLASA